VCTCKDSLLSLVYALVSQSQTPNTYHFGTQLDTPCTGWSGCVIETLLQMTSSILFNNATVKLTLQQNMYHKCHDAKPESVTLVSGLSLGQTMQDMVVIINSDLVVPWECISSNRVIEC